MEKLLFSVISDSHITHFNDGHAMFSLMARYHKENLPKMDMSVFLGDIVYQLDSPLKGTCDNIYENHYDFVNDCLNTYFKDTKNVMVLGNHEFAQGSSDAELTAKALEVWERKFGQPHTEHFLEKGYHFIKAPVLSYSCITPKEIEQELIAMLSNALTDGDKPVFLLSHCAAPSTVYYTEGAEYFSQEFRAFLAKHSRIIHITGHEHLHVLDEGAIYQDKFTTISAPMVSVGAFGFNVKDNEPIFNICQILWFEVEDRRVTVHRVDVTGGGEVGTPWIIDIDEIDRGIMRYDDTRISTAPVPAFAADAVLIPENKGRGEVWFNVKQSFANDVMVQYYYLTLYDRFGMPVFSQRYVSDFYYLGITGKYADLLPLKVKGLRPSKYTAKVFALNSVLGQSENSLECEIIL